MTIANQSNRVQYTANGQTSAFAVPFLFYDPSHLRVYLGAALKTLNTDYAVIGAGAPAGGAVLFTSVPAANVVVTIARRVPVTQELDLENFSVLDVEQLERALDLAVMRDQQLNDQAGRTLTVPESSTEVPPDPSQYMADMHSARTAAQGAASQADLAADNAAAAAAAAAQSAIAATAAAGGGVVMVTAADASADVLDATLLMGTGLAKTVNNPGGAETMTLSLTTDPATLIPKTVLAANQILKADSANTPTGLSVPEQTLVGRLAGGSVEALAVEQVMSLVFPSGAVMDYAGATAPSGWLLLQGGTIGDGASAGSARAHADCQALFQLLWNAMADAQCPVVGGRGASAAEDWAAHKKLTLPDARGRGLIGSGQGSGLTSRAHGDKGGEEAHALTSDENGPHTHQESAIVGGAGLAPGSGPNWTSGGTTGSSGLGAAHNTMQPWLALNKIIKL